MGSTSGRRLVGLVVVGGFLLFDAPKLEASTIALSSINALTLTLTLASGTITFEPFTTQAFAQAQNSLGELDSQLDHPSGTTTASVTWATASATADGTAWSAASDVNLPGGADASASATGQGLWSVAFTIEPETGADPADVDVDVDVSVDISGELKVATDAHSLFAETDTTFNLLLDVDPDDDPWLFSYFLLSVGPNDAHAESFGDTLLGSRRLLFGTTYHLLLRVDSESRAATVPESSSTLALAGLGLVFLASLKGRLRLADRRSRERTYP